MPTFMDSLAANPSGGIYGQPAPNNDQDVLGLVNRLKDREMQDFKEKANFMSDLTLRQNRMARMYDPSMNQNGNTNNANPTAGMNTVVRDPNAMTGYEKGELGIRQQGLGLESQKLAQQKQLGQEGIDLKTQQEKLNQQKSDQIRDQKQAELQHKIDEAGQKFDIATKGLENRALSAEAQLKLHKDIADSAAELNRLKMEHMQNNFDITSKQHQQTINNLTEQLKQKKNEETTTEVSADGTKKTVKHTRGDKPALVSVTGKDGQSYQIPADKVDDWNENHAPDE